MADEQKRTESLSHSRHEPSRNTMAREQRRQRAVRRKARRRTFYFIGGSTLAAMLVVSLLLPSLPFGRGGGSESEAKATPTRDTADNEPIDRNVGTQYIIQGREHIQPGERHPPYNSTPPTSGWHFVTPAAWGIYESRFPDETVVHNLEHGGIAFSYNLNPGPRVDELENFVRGQPGFPGCFVMQRYERVPLGSLALTAWGRLMNFDNVDTEGFNFQEMQRFIKAHKNQGPEFVGPGCGGSQTMERPGDL